MNPSVRILGTPEPVVQGDIVCTQADCTSDALDGAPVPLCNDHLWLTYAWMARQVPGLPLNMLMAPRYEDDPHLDPPPARTRTTILGKPGHVYFIRKDGLIKIGWSSQVDRRLAELRPHEVLHTQPGTVEDERRCHAAFVHLRVHHEYFTAGADLLAFIADLRSAAAA